MLVFLEALECGDPHGWSLGGIYGLLMAYGLIFGERVLLFMMLFPMKAKHFVWILAAFGADETRFIPQVAGLASRESI